MTGQVQDFSNKRLSAAEWSLIREAYAETYPVRPLLNHVDELKAAARDVIEQMDLTCMRASEEISVAEGCPCPLCVLQRLAAADGEVKRG